MSCHGKRVNTCLLGCMAVVSLYFRLHWTDISKCCSHMISQRACCSLYSCSVSLSVSILLFTCPLLVLHSSLTCPFTCPSPALRQPFTSPLPALHLPFTHHLPVTFPSPACVLAVLACLQLLGCPLRRPPPPPHPYDCGDPSSFSTFLACQYSPI